MSKEDFEFTDESNGPCFGDTCTRTLHRFIRHKPQTQSSWCCDKCGEGVLDSDQCSEIEKIAKQKEL